MTNQPQINLNASIPAVGSLIIEALKHQGQGKTKEVNAAILDAFALIYPGADPPLVRPVLPRQINVSRYAIKKTADDINKLGSLVGFAASELSKPKEESSMTQYECVALLELVSRSIDICSDFLFDMIESE